MKRRVNRQLLDEYIHQHGPDGVSKLAVESKVSASTIQKARSTGEAPKKLSTLQRLSEILGHNVDVAFPIEEEKAS